MAKPKHYDGPPGYLRIHLGYCPRAFTSDGECACWKEAELVKLPGGSPATRKGPSK